MTWAIVAPLILLVVLIIVDALRRSPSDNNREDQP